MGFPPSNLCVLFCYESNSTQIYFGRNFQLMCIVLRTLNITVQLSCLISRIFIELQTFFVCIPLKFYHPFVSLSFRFKYKRHKKMTT